MLEWTWIPFGLINALPVFQSNMNECWVGMCSVICISYLDDTLTYSETFDDHLRDVQKVLKRLRGHGVKLNPKKCEWFCKEAKYTLSEEGFKVDGASDETINKFKEAPKTVGDLSSLLGFIGYYWSYIKDFSNRAKLLYDLLCKDKQK